ncbi:MAG: hypothetical protein ACK5QS_08850 [Pseudanabaenaceae cyanobacterium]
MKLSGSDLLAVAIFSISMLALLGPVLNLSPTIPAAIALIGLALYGMDVGWWQGRGSQAMMLWINRQSPEYQRRVACHEAGHFLAAYLLDLPISSYSTGTMIDGSAAEGQSLYTEGNLVINGMADLAASDGSNNDGSNTVANSGDEVDQRSLLQKLTTVAMAGIVAEELLCEGTAQGGSTDYQQLRHLLRYQGTITHQTSTNYGLQERWAKLRARDLLRPHEATLQILATAMMQQASLAQCLTTLRAQLNRTTAQNPLIIEKNLVIPPSK